MVLVRTAFIAFLRLIVVRPLVIVRITGMKRGRLPYAVSIRVVIMTRLTAVVVRVPHFRTMFPLVLVTICERGLAAPVCWGFDWPVALGWGVGLASPCLALVLPWVCLVIWDLQLWVPRELNLLNVVWTWVC